MDEVWPNEYLRIMSFIHESVEESLTLSELVHWFPIQADAVCRSLLPG